MFPDAQFVFLHREPRANLGSMMEAWRSRGWVTYQKLAGWNGPWSMLLPPGYEDLIRDPATEIAKLLEFAGLAMDARLAEYLSKPLPLSRHTKTPPRSDKWRQDEAEIERVMPGLAEVNAKVAFWGAE